MGEWGDAREEAGKQSSSLHLSLHHYLPPPICESISPCPIPCTRTYLRRQLIDAVNAHTRSQNQGTKTTERNRWEIKLITSWRSRKKHRTTSTRLDTTFYQRSQAHERTVVGKPKRSDDEGHARSDQHARKRRSTWNLESESYQAATETEDHNYQRPNLTRDKRQRPGTKSRKAVKRKREQNNNQELIQVLRRDGQSRSKRHKPSYIPSINLWNKDQDTIVVDIFMRMTPRQLLTRCTNNKVHVLLD